MAKREKLPILAIVFCMFVGVLLAGEGITAIMEKKWPVRVAPGLDLFLAVFSIFGEPWNSYTAGAFLIAVGLLFISVPVISRLYQKK